MEHICSTLTKEVLPYALLNYFDIALNPSDEDEGEDDEDEGSGNED